MRPQVILSRVPKDTSRHLQAKNNISSFLFHFNKEIIILCLFFSSLCLESVYSKSHPGCSHVFHGEFTTQTFRYGAEPKLHVLAW